MLKMLDVQLFATPEDTGRVTKYFHGMNTIQHVSSWQQILILISGFFC